MEPRRSRRAAGGCGGNGGLAWPLPSPAASALPAGMLPACPLRCGWSEPARGPRADGCWRPPGWQARPPPGTSAQLLLCLPRPTHCGSPQVGCPAAGQTAGCGLWWGHRATGLVARETAAAASGCERRQAGARDVGRPPPFGHSRPAARHIQPAAHGVSGGGAARVAATQRRRRAAAVQLCHWCPNRLRAQARAGPPCPCTAPRRAGQRGKRPLSGAPLDKRCVGRPAGVVPFAATGGLAAPPRCSSRLPERVAGGREAGGGVGGDCCGRNS